MTSRTMLLFLHLQCRGGPFDLHRRLGLAQLPDLHHLLGLVRAELWAELQQERLHLGLKLGRQQPSHSTTGRTPGTKRRARSAGRDAADVEDLRRSRVRLRRLPHSEPSKLSLLTLLAPAAPMVVALSNASPPRLPHSLFPHSTLPSSPVPNASSNSPNASCFTRTASRRLGCTTTSRLTLPPPSSSSRTTPTSAPFLPCSGCQCKACDGADAHDGTDFKLKKKVS